MKHLVLKIDENLHKEFKKTTAEYDESMTSIVVGCIKKYLADKKKVVIY